MFFLTTRWHFRLNRGPCRDLFTFPVSLWGHAFPSGQFPSSLPVWVNSLIMCPTCVLLPCPLPRLSCAPSPVFAAPCQEFLRSLPLWVSSIIPHSVFVLWASRVILLTSPASLPLLCLILPAGWLLASMAILLLSVCDFTKCRNAGWPCINLFVT